MIADVQLWCAPDEVAGSELLSESLYEYDLSMGTLFDMLSHRPEIFAGFLRAC
jgi:hypothetical protein